MGNLQPHSKIKLEKAIRHFELESYSSDIINVARECIRIIATEEIECDAIAQSRIGGPPDLEHMYQWPKYGYGECQNELSVFYFQINLSDIPFFIDSCLPEKGILSVFSTSQHQLEDDGEILYFNSPSSLSRQTMPDINEFGDKDLDHESHIPTCFHAPRKLEFEVSISLPGYLDYPECFQDEDENLDRYLELVDSFTQVQAGEEIGFIQAHPCQPLPEEDASEWATLFNLHSRSRYFSFGDFGNCAISQLRKKAKNGDFSDIEFNYCEPA